MIEKSEKIEAWDSILGQYVKLQWFKVKVIGKTKEKGIFWGNWYKVAFRVDNLGIVFSKNVSFPDYCQVDVGDGFYFLFRSIDDEYWELTSKQLYSKLPPYSK